MAMIEIIVFIVGMAGVRDQTRRMRLHEESGIPVDRAKDMVKRATGIPRRQFFLETRRQGNRWEWAPKSRVLTDVPQASRSSRGGIIVLRARMGRHYRPRSRI